jgi:hypothetical protein
MGNFLYHNKWHRFNHHTVPTSGFPDSAIDPIASFEFPFKGIFFNKIYRPVFYNSVYYPNLGRETVRINIDNVGSGYTVTPSLSLQEAQDEQGNVGKVIRQPTFVVQRNATTNSISGVVVLNRGIFYQPVVLYLNKNLGGPITETALVSLVDREISNDSDSLGWGIYSSLVATYSGEWELYPSVRATVSGIRVNNTWPVNWGLRFYHENWNSGFVGYTYWFRNSIFIDSTYNTVQQFSAENVWPLSTEGRFPPPSGRGWHIALSAITWKTNISSVNTRQKVAVPVELAETGLKTVNWNVSAAQTAYFSLTGNYTLTADKVFNARKGGKYTMWISLDYCKEVEMNFVFNPRTYVIHTRKPLILDKGTVSERYALTDGPDSYQDNNNVVRLSANNITRIDFVFDGTRMLGKATHYKSILPTEDDTYYQGIGNTLDPNPAYVNGLGEPYDHIVNGPGISMIPFSNTFTSVSALYVGGSGVFINYFSSIYQLFNFTLNGAAWQPETSLLSNRALTSSFDRAFGNLSGGDYNLRAFSSNLFATPAKSTAPDIMLSSYPNPPYVFTKLRSVEIPTCLSTIKVSIFSGKDRDIKRISLNSLPYPVLGPLLSGYEQKYNTDNERQSEITLNRIQNNFNFVVFYEKQEPLKGVTPIIWFDSIDRHVVATTTGRSVSSIISKPNRGLFLTQSNSTLQPILSATTITPSIEFRGPNLVRRSTNIMTTNTGLTSLSSPSSINQNNIKNFTQFTVVEPLSVVSGSNQIIWWLGDYSSNIGYGAAMVGNKVGVGNFRGGSSPYTVVISTYTVENNKPFVITSSVGNAGGAGGSSTPAARRHSAFINGRRISNIEPGVNGFSVNVGLTSSKFSMGGVGDYFSSLSANSGSFRLLANLIYEGELSLPKIAAINTHLINKFNIR